MSGPTSRYGGGTVKYAPQEIADAGMIDAFKMKARNWWNDVQKLKTMQVPPQLEGERQKLLSYAETVKNAIQKVTSLSDSLKIQGLGVLPLIPVAIVAAALAAIAYWAKDYASFLKQVEYQRQLVSQGIDPKKAADIAQDAHALENAQASPLQFLVRNWQWVLIGIGGLFVFKYLKDKI